MKKNGIVLWFSSQLFLVLCVATGLLGCQDNLKTGASPVSLLNPIGGTVVADAPELATTDVLVLNVTSDSAGNYQLYAVVGDDHAVTGLRVVSSSKRTFHTLTQLQSGVALYTKKRGLISKDVIRLNVEDFTAAQGGKAILTLLRQYGIFARDDYRTYEMHVVRGEGNGWTAFRKIANQAVFIDGLLFETRIDSGSEVGIESVAAQVQNKDVEKINTSQLPVAQDLENGGGGTVSLNGRISAQCGRFLI